MLSITKLINYATGSVTKYLMSPKYLNTILETNTVAHALLDHRPRRVLLTPNSPETSTRLSIKQVSMTSNTQNNDKPLTVAHVALGTILNSYERRTTYECTFCPFRFPFHITGQLWFRDVTRILKSNQTLATVLTLYDSTLFSFTNVLWMTVNIHTNLSQLYDRRVIHSKLTRHRLHEKSVSFQRYNTEAIA